MAARGQRSHPLQLALLALALSGCTGPGLLDPGEIYVKQVPERSHIVELDEEWLYVLDPDSGLDVINVSNPAAPTVLERVAGTGGRVLEMFRDRQRMYVLYESSQEECAPLPGLDPVFGHDVWTDVAIVAHLPDAPLLASRFCVPGLHMGSAKRNDFLYVMTKFDEHHLLLSIDVSDPFAPVIAYVDHEIRGSLWTQLHLARGVLFVAVSAGARAHIRYHDISDDAGVIVQRGQIGIDASYESPIFMDATGEHLFVAVSRPSGAALYAVDVSDPDDLVVAGSIDSMSGGEMLWDVVFEDDLVYVTTTSQYPGDHLDNLWIVSREDATVLRKLSSLTIPSWSLGFAVVEGQLIAVGRGPSGASAAVSLHNIVDLRAPQWIDMETFGDADGPSGWYLDVRGAGVMTRGELADPSLIVVPYTRYLWDGFECVPERHLQFLDTRWTALRLLGDWTPLERHGRAEEVVQVGNKVYVVSDVGVTVLGVMDREAPREHVMLSLGGDPADGCGEVEPNLGEVRDDVVSIFEVGCSIAEPSRGRWPGLLALIASLVLLLRRRRWKA